MATPTNLFEYYQGQGKALPSLTDRSGLYSQYGLGTGYAGTAEQNTALLGKLLGGSASTSNPTISSLYQQGQNIQSQIPTIQTGINNLNSGVSGIGGTTGGSNTQNTIDTSGNDVASILKALGYGSTDTNNYQSQITDLLNKLSTQNTAYTDWLKGQPTAADQYETYRTKLGLPEKEAALTETNTQLQKTQSMIDDLEKNINARISGFDVTEAGRQRELAVEQKPLTQNLQTLQRLAGIEQTGLTSGESQLSQMLGLASQDQATQQALAKAPLEYTQSIIPLLQDTMNYQSPQEKLQQELLLAQGQAQIKNQYDVPSTVTPEKGLTVAQVQAMGLPISASGETQTQILSDLSSASVPQWFNIYINSILTNDKNRKGQTISPQESQARWNEYRAKILSGTIKGTTTGGTTVDNLYGSI